MYGGVSLVVGSVAGIVKCTAEARSAAKLWLAGTAMTVIVSYFTLLLSSAKPIHALALRGPQSAVSI